MFHFVAHARPPTNLFCDWQEAAALWRRLARMPGLRALVLMPNHVHLLSSVDDPRSFDSATRAYAQWRNHHRGRRGQVWQTRPPVETVPDGKHARRTLRYVHLNPCRAKLVACPSMWPFSTHRDALGLAVDPVRDRVRDPVGFHDYVSSDPSCRVTGTPYPGDRSEAARPALQSLAGAVSELTRQPLARVATRSRERRMWISAAKTLTTWPGKEIARVVGVSKATVSMTAPLPARLVGPVSRLLADPRFPGLVDDDPRLRRWR